MLFLPMDIQAKDINEFRERLGFNDPLLIQYFRFIGKAIQGDFGHSLRYKEDAFGLVLSRIPATMSLAFVALGLSVTLSLPIGIISAARRNSLYDRLGILGTVLGQSIPGFWLGLMMIYLFSVRLRWLPTGGWGTPQQFIMPAIALAAFSSARMARLTRSTVLDVLGQDYIRTARAKGIGEILILTKHALKNAAIPVVTLAGLEMGQLLGGAVITETIFAWPGLGRLVVQALLNRDFPIVMAGVFLTATMYTLINFGIDILYSWLNPQIRYT